MTRKPRKYGDHAGGFDDGAVLKPSQLKTDTNPRTAVSSGVGTSSDVRNRENNAHTHGKYDVGAKPAAVKSDPYRVAEKRRLTGDE